MADASAKYPVTGLGNDPMFKAAVNALNALINDVSLLRAYQLNRLATVAGTFSLTSNITNGGTSGKAKTTNTISFIIGGVEYTKAATDDLFDLTGLSYNATLYRGVLFLLSPQGTATVTSALSTTAAKAVQSVLALHSTSSSKAAIHCYVANPAGTFSNSALTALGSFNQSMVPDLTAWPTYWG